MRKREEIIFSGSKQEKAIEVIPKNGVLIFESSCIAKGTNAEIRAELASQVKDGVVLLPQGVTLVGILQR